MKDFFEYLIKNIVDQPDCVEVRLVSGEKRTLLEISVAKEDLGKVIGKNGKIIRSLRTLGVTLGARMGQKVQVEVIQ